MNAFQKAIEDVFNVPQFKDKFLDLEDENKQITCIIYQRNFDQGWTQFGKIDDVNFYITCKVADYTPSKNKRLQIHGTTYKIDTFHADSFNLTYNIYLRSLTAKI